MPKKVDLSEEKKVVLNLPAKELSRKHNVSFKDKKAVYTKRRERGIISLFSFFNA